MISRISTVEAKAKISEAINRVAYGGEQLVITRRGQELAALIPIQDFRRWTATATVNEPPAREEESARRPEGDEEGLAVNLL